MSSIEEAKQRVDKIIQEIHDLGGNCSSHFENVEEPNQGIWFTLNFPDGISDSTLKSVTNELVNARDAYNKAMGGSGLRVNNVRGDLWMTELEPPKSKEE